MKQKKEKTTREASNPMRGYQIVLSVRGATGPAFRFEHRSRSLSRTEAILEAEKAALEEAKKDLTQLQVLKKQKEIDLETKENDIRKHTGELNNLKSNHAYKAMLGGAR